MVIVNPKPNLKYSMDGYVKEIYDSFIYAVHNKNTSIVIIGDGRSGMGKTTLINQGGIYIDPTYGLHKIFFTPEDFLEALSNAKEGDFILFDEAMIISNRSTLSKINTMIIQAMSMIRSKRIVVAFCVNSIFDLDRNLVLSRADLLLHVYGDSLIDRGKFMAFFKSKGDQIDRLKLLYLYGKKMYDYGKPRANFYGSFGKEFVVNEIEYEKKKQIGINKFLKGGSSLTNKSRLILERLIPYIYKNKIMKVKDIAEICKVSRQTIFNLVKEVEGNEP